MNARHDFTHQVTHRATAKAVVSCVEDLNVSGMVRTPKLALSVSDAGMGEILRQAEYKSAWRGRHVVRIDRWAPSSKTCSACNHTSPPAGETAPPAARRMTETRTRPSTSFVGG